MFEWHGFGGGGMGLFWILIIIALIGFVAFAIKSSGISTSKEKSALEILKERYAKGEIDREEFEQKQKDLNT